MSDFHTDTYVKSQGVYRLEYIEWQVANDAAFQANNLDLEQLLLYSLMDGYQDLKQMLNSWFKSSHIDDEDVMEYLFIKSHPQLFECQRHQTEYS